MGDVGADEGRMELPIDVDVGAVSALTGEESLVFFARCGGTDAGCIAGCSLNGALFQGDASHSPDNVLVSGATANVAFETIPDLIIVRVWVAPQKFPHAHNHAGGTEAAL